MTVSIGDVITASQYNTLKDSINKWYGDVYSSNTPASSKATSSYGWGGVNAAAVTTGTIITADQTNHLINRINQGVLETGASSVITKVSSGDIVLASKHNDIEAKSAVLDSSRLLASNHTTTSGGADDSEVRGSWSNSVSITATATFATYAQARYFFNSGGQLRISFNNTGTSDDALAWDDLWSADDMGTLIFSYNNFAQTGSRPGNFVGSSGFYELTTTPTEIYNINLDESPYTSNDFRVNASRNSTGTQVILTFTMNNDDPQAELVDGNTVCFLDHRKANSQNSTDPTVNFSVTGFSTFALGSWSGS
jgi:hypothetical protein